MTSGVSRMPPVGSALPSASPVNCLVWSTSRIQAGVVKTRRRKMRGVGVRHDQLGERVALELGVEVEAGGALEIVEAVAVLQLLELVLEHEVEGRAQHAAERHLLLGKAADPKIDGVEAGRGDAIGAAGPGAGRVRGSRAGRWRAGAAKHESVAAARCSSSVLALVIDECVP